MPLDWYVYILQCADNTLYTGASPDPERRLAKHNSGKAAKYTRGRRPVELLYRERHSCRSSALRREFEIKRMKKSQKLSLIRNQGET